MVARTGGGGGFLFTYLGQPLSANRLRIEDFTPICQQTERRLCGCSSLLSYDGRFLLIKFVFSAPAIFFMSTLALPTSISEQINKYPMHFFWRKYGQEQAGPLSFPGTRFVNLKIRGAWNSRHLTS